MKTAPALLLLLVVVAATGCSGVRKGKLRGCVAFGFEHVAFRECGNDRSWWLAESATAEGWDQARRILDAAAACEPGPGKHCPRPQAYVEAFGAVSAEGHYGHLGGFPREVRLSRVEAASATPPADCPCLSPVP